MNRQGFTLLELLIVIAILAIFIALMTPNLTQARRRAFDQAALLHARNVAIAIESSRNLSSGALDTSRLLCSDFITTAPGVVTACDVSYQNNTNDFIVDIAFSNGTASRALYNSATGSAQLQ
jgi:type IV pilus assembly protein PilA